MLRASLERARRSTARLSPPEAEYLRRMAFACSSGMLAAAARRIDDSDPRTWEFSAFSQNGEDGVVEMLLNHATSPDRSFVEIGASDGLENNSAYLALVRKYRGVMVEADSTLSRQASRVLTPYNVGVNYLNLMVEPENVSTVLASSLTRSPDFFSLDIDGNDYHVARALLALGFRPKVVCVEYNSTFGPDRAVTIPYQRGFDYHAAHPTHLYYGASIGGWRSLFEEFDYAFVTAETNGVNAFFVDPAQVRLDVTSLDRQHFVENFAQRQRFRKSWSEQFEEISALPLLDVG